MSGFVLMAPVYTSRWLVRGRRLIHMDWMKEHRGTVGKTDFKSDHFSFHHNVSLLVERSQSLLAFAFIFWLLSVHLPPVSLRIIFQSDLPTIINALSFPKQTDTCHHAFRSYTHKAVMQCWRVRKLFPIQLSSNLFYSDNEKEKELDRITLPLTPLKYPW